MVYLKIEAKCHSIRDKSENTNFCIHPKICNHYWKKTLRKMENSWQKHWMLSNKPFQIDYMSWKGSRKRGGWFNMNRLIKAKKCGRPSSTKTKRKILHRIVTDGEKWIENPGPDKYLFNRLRRTLVATQCNTRNKNSGKAACRENNWKIKAKKRHDRNSQVNANT